ncbi:toll/interleukin-1 receptor domain-containing protein [Streptacidiphilus sp. EB103A]|uniref:toll/interleukin-1 receptor domain-containing protein n=1 Tax=Streptacidiphilus sp. EB103A TaxID=3156275 RepID=UPI003513E7F5
MARVWSPNLRLQLVEALAEMSGADSESFFDAHRLGDAYRRPGQRSSKKSRINSALQFAESQGNPEDLLEAAAGFCGFSPRNEVGNSSTELLIEERNYHLQGVGKVPLNRSIFISHASKDQELAGEIKNFLVLAGLPNEMIFFSSHKSTGIPAGKNVLEHLQTTLAGSALVIEVITKNFLTRPYCLMELGGAWALGKETYPLVIPPLSVEEVVQAIGNVQMGILGSDDEIDAVFEEIHEQLTVHAAVSLPIRPWNEALRGFKRALDRIRAADEKQSAASRTVPSRQGSSSTRVISAPVYDPHPAELEASASELRAALKKLNVATRKAVMHTVTWRQPVSMDWDDAREAIERKELDVEDEGAGLTPNVGHPIVRKAIEKAEAWKSIIEDADPEYREKFEEENEIPLDAQSVETWAAFNLV